MNPSSNISFTDNIVYLLGSSTFMVVSLLFKIWLKKNYKKFKKAKIYSVKEFFKNKKDLENEDVIVIGKYYKDLNSQNSTTFFLKNHSSNNLFGNFFNNYLQISPDFLFMFNARSGSIEKNLFNYNFAIFIFSIYFYKKIFQSRNLSLIFHLVLSLLNEQYFLNNDIIGVYGKVKNTSKSVQLEPKFIFQGNFSMMKNLLKNQIYFWDICFKYSAISVVCQSIVSTLHYFLKKIFPKKMSFKNNKENIISNELRMNCVKCKTNYVNVMMSDCNHFNLCFQCFYKKTTPRMCILQNG